MDTHTYLDIPRHTLTEKHTLRETRTMTHTHTERDSSTHGERDYRDADTQMTLEERHTNA